MARKARKKREVDEWFIRDLNRIADLCFEEAWSRDWTWSDLARFSGVSLATVTKLGERLTRFPELLTVQKMARSVGVRVILSDRPEKKRLKAKLKKAVKA